MNNLESIIARLLQEQSEPDTEKLSSLVLASIKKEEFRLKRIKVIVFRFLFAFSAVGLLASIVAIVRQMTSSGLLAIINVAVTNFTTLAANWSDMFSSLAESLPLASIAFGLLAAAAVLYSLRGMSVNKLHHA